MTIRYKRTQVCVSGKGRFPIDMLRYDNCTPAKECDAHMIALVDTSTAAQIRLYRYSPEGTKATEARWKSYGWSVVYDDGI